MQARLACPTLLLCGISGGSPSMWPVKRALRKDGILAERLGSPIVLMRTIGHYAKRARARIERFHRKTGQRITLVGLSMGGLVAVDAMSDPATADRVRRVIAVASPFDGSYPAYLAAHRLGRLLLKAPGEIVPGTPTLARLQAVANDPDRTWELVTINGPPYLDALAPAPLRLVEPDLALTGPYTHAALVWHRRLQILVKDLILADRLTAFR